MKQAVTVITQMKSRNPSVSITVVDVVDPLKVDVGNIVQSKQEKEDDFPLGFVDRFVVAPLFDGKAEKNSTYFITHQKKIRKWMFMQCDIVAIYHYDLLPFANISTRVWLRRESLNLLRSMMREQMPSLRKKRKNWKVKTKSFMIDESMEIHIKKWQKSSMFLFPGFPSVQEWLYQG